MAPPPTPRLIDLVLTGNLLVHRHNARSDGVRRLYRRPVPRMGRWSVRRINALHAALPGLRDYLEVGLASGETFEQVRVRNRTGVDPVPTFDLEDLPRRTRVVEATSDEFFASDDGRFDLVFLDGMHVYQQTYRDLVNTLQVCSGLVLVDDVVPKDEVSAIPDQRESYAERARRGWPKKGRPWHGDVFRMVPCVVDHHPELEWRTIVGSGNPQLLVWKPDPTVRTVSVSDEVLEGYAAVTYADVFSDGVPPSFRPVEEDEAIASASAALADRYGKRRPRRS